MCAQTAPTSHRQALFGQVVVPNEVPIVPPSQGGSAASDPVGIGRPTELNLNSMVNRGSGIRGPYFRCVYCDVGFW
jgi:hypothetical protein